jgi:exocyst complex component 4
MNYISHAKYRLGKTNSRQSNQVEENPKHRHTRTSSAPIRDLASFADEYRKLAIDCLKVLRVEMQLETIFHMQVCKTCVINIYFVLMGIDTI